MTPKTTIAKIFLFIAVFFLIFSSWSGWNESSRIFLTKSIVDDGVFTINNYAHKTGDKSYYEGNYYSDKMPGTSFLSVPFFLLSRDSNVSHFNDVFISNSSLDNYQQSYPDSFNFSVFLATYFLSGLATVLTALLLYKISEEFIANQKIRYLIPIIFCLGTIAISGAIYLQGHATAAFYCFSSFFIFYYKEKIFPKFWPLLSGLMLGIAFLIEMTAFFLFILLYLAFLTKKQYKESLFYLIGFLSICILLLGYNYLNFNNPLEFGYFNLEWEKGHVSGEVDFDYYNQKMRDDLSLEKFDKGMEKFIPINLLLNPTFWSYRFIIILRILFSLERGLFILSPILLLSLFGFPYFYKKRKDIFFSILFFIFMLLWFKSTPYIKWWGGASFGVRHLIIMIPFLIVLMMPVLNRLKKETVYLILSLSLVISIISFSNPLDIASRPIIMSQNYQNQIYSIRPLDNQIKRQFSYILQNGLSVPLLQNGISGSLFDIRGFVGDDKKVLTIILEEKRLEINLKIISFLLPLLLLLIVWRPKLGSKEGKLLILLCLFLFFFSFNINKATSLEVGDQSEFIYKAETKNFLIFADEEKTKNVDIAIDPIFGSGYLNIYFNNKKIKKLKISNQTFFFFNLELKEGKNKISFRSSSDNALENYLSVQKFPIFRIADIKLSKQPSLSLHRLKNCGSEDFSIEKENNYEKKWISNCAFLDLRNTQKANVLIELKSYHKEREFLIGEKKYLIKTNTEQVLIDSAEKLRFFGSCSAPAQREIKSLDYRCLGLLIKKVELIL